MDEQPQQPRSSMPPVWVWIIVILGVVVLAQLYFGRMNAGDEAQLEQVAAALNNGESVAVEVNGNRITVSYPSEPNRQPLQATKPTDADFYSVMQAYGVSDFATADITFIDNTGWSTVLSLVFSVGPILLLIWIFTRGFRQMQGGGNNIFGFGRSKARTLTDANRPTVTFADVAGVDEAKEEVVEVVQFLREPEKFVQVGARIPRGVLMVGPPGTGKTLLARAIAGEAGVPFFHISGSEFVEMFVGVGASRVRDLFEKAKQNAPSIVFVDEIDAVGRQRGAGLGGGHDEREQTLNQILVEMDGFTNDTNIIVIAATNRDDVLDPALLRPGRFDRKVIVDLPDVRGREAILRVHSRGKPIAKDVSLSDMARLTAGFSGADLENLINEAAIFAARHTLTEIGLREFQDAFDRVVMGPERKSAVMSAHDKEVVAYHEAGHAVVSHFLPNSDPVQKITIIPRGRAGGYVMRLPEDRLVESKEFMEDSIAVALGGRAAEEIFFDQITSGAAGDLQYVTRVARHMVMQLGMSERLGLRTFGEQMGSVFLGRSMGIERNYSEEAAKAIDEEVRRLVDENYDKARHIIEENRGRLERLAEVLMEKETLDRAQFESLMNEEPSGAEDAPALIPAD